MNYTITNDTIMAVVDGNPVTVRKGAPNFNALAQALLSGDEANVRANLTVARSLESWAQGKFTVEGETVKYNGEPLPSELNKRIVALAAANESPEPLFRFWENLKQNPSNRSVEQLWGFLQHCGIPLTEDGCFLAYKGVDEQLKDQYTHTIDNSPGQTVKMERNQISDDPRTPCHYGLHVGALSYAISFGPRCIIVKVNPRDVVCVPYDENARKMRVCEYTVQGHYSGQLADTLHSDENDPDQLELDTEVDEDELEHGCCGEGEECSECASDDEGGKAGEQEPEQPVVTVPKKWARLHKMTTAELYKQPIEKLRKYAGKALKIIGASKLPGGKTTLIGRILQVREGLPTNGGDEQ